MSEFFGVSPYLVSSVKANGDIDKAALAERAEPITASVLNAVGSR
ncbi:hypothetical protein [Dickeya dianthicola]